MHLSSRRQRPTLSLLLMLLLLFSPYLWADPGGYKPWFRVDRLNMLLAVIIVSSAIIYYISHATRGQKLFLRRIPGVSAVEEAVGRATEMGRSIIFVPGISIWTMSRPWPP